MQQDESENGIAKQEGFNLFHNKKEDKITMSHNPHTKIHFHLHYFGEPVDLFSPQISPPTDPGSACRTLSITPEKSCGDITS